MFTEARFPKANSVEMGQNLCRQNIYFMKHKILYLNQSLKPLNVFSVFSSPSGACFDRLQSWIVQNSLYTSYLVNWILARFSGNELISSIFCFHIYRKHRPSGSCLCPTMCHVTWIHLMLTDVDKLETCESTVVWPAVLMLLWKLRHVKGKWGIHEKRVLATRVEARVICFALCLEKGRLATRQPREFQGRI